MKARVRYAPGVSSASGRQEGAGPEGRSAMPAPEVTKAEAGAGRFWRRLTLVLLAINGLVLLMAGAFLAKSRAQYEDLATADTRNLAQVLEQVLRVTVGKVDLALGTIKEEYERPGADLQGLIESHFSRLSMLDGLRTADAQGRAQHGIGVVPGDRVNLSDRSYFQQLREHPEAGLVISRPLRTGGSGRGVIILARRLEKPDRSFQGIVYAVLPLEQLTAMFSSLDVGPGGSITIRDGDLGLIARLPDPVNRPLGDRAVAEVLAEAVRTGRQAGSWRWVSTIDGRQRRCSFQKVPDLPFYVVVGLATRDYMRGWWREAAVALGGVAIFGLVTGIAGRALYGSWQRQQAAFAAQAQLLAQVKTLGEMLPICSHCKKIRDDRGYWNRIEEYLHEHMDAEFTHGICPDCAKAFLAESGSPDEAERRL